MNGHERQKEQSKRMIEDALFELIAEKDFAQITVSEIAERADVARRTFYRLYQGKEEVVHSFFERLCLEYRDGHEALSHYDIARIANDYFSFWYKHRDVLLLLHRRGLDKMLYYEIGCLSMGTVKNRIGSGEKRELEGIHYFLDYSAGGFMNLLYRWVAEGMEDMPEEFAGKVSRALLEFLRG